MKTINDKDKFQVAVDYLCEYSGVKIAVMMPNILAACCGPALSPTRAAMIDGIDQAVTPKQRIEA